MNCNPFFYIIPTLLVLAISGCAEQTSPKSTQKPNQAVTAESATLETSVNTHNSSAIQANPQPSTHNWQWQTVAQGLSHPWALAFLPDGAFLVSERSGNLRVVNKDGKVGTPIRGLPAIDAGGQGGLLDVVLDKAFASTRKLYFCFSEKGNGGNSTALAEAVLSADNSALTQVKTLFSQRPKVASTAHFGCRIALTDTHIFVSTGDRYDERAKAQTLDNHLGKIIRINRDGTTPSDNPFVGKGLGEIWSIGHRNIQGMTIDPQGRLWASEHGAQGGDEINLIDGGKNYGWPVITHGVDYGGGKIGEGIREKAGMQQPLYHWTPSVAPSGLSFVGENPYGADWRGNLLSGSLKFGYVGRLTLDGTRVLGEEKIEVGERVRDVRQAPDGYIYAITDSSNGRILKLLPR